MAKLKPKNKGLGGPASLSGEELVKRSQRTLKYWKAAGYQGNLATVELGVADSTFRRHLVGARRWARTKAGKEWCQTHGVDANHNTKSGARVVPPDVHAKDLIHQIVQLKKTIEQQERHNITVRGIREHIFEMARHEPHVPGWVNDRPVGSHRHGVPTLMLSDIHYGEVVKPGQVFGVNEYDTETAIRRVRRVVDSACALLRGDVLTDPNFPGIVLILGGDMVSGIIHDELTETNQKTIMQQATECADLVHSCILKLVREFSLVYVVGVPGNHGRNTRKPHAKDYAELSFDWLIYQMLERFLVGLTAQGKVVFNCPAARDVTFRVAGRPFRLTHGDQFRGGDGIIGPLGPITRGDKKKRAMAMTLPTNDEQYETLVLGHFHTLHQDARRIINGSTKGYDEYALSQNFEFELPQQALWLTHHKYGINHMMPIHCEDPGEPRQTPDWVSFSEAANLRAPIQGLLDGLDWAMA